VRLFVTHGGLNSTYEGVTAGLPLVVLPYFADQPINAMHVVNKGLGTMVGFLFLVGAVGVRWAGQDACGDASCFQSVCVCAAETQVLVDRAVGVMKQASMMGGRQ
jgi:hypothetical protein